MKCPICKCEFTPNLKNRSTQENRYYFGVVVKALSELTGFNPDEMHEILKHKFLKKSVWITNIEKGTVEEVVITQSTTELTTVEFENYLAKIRQWAGEELNCPIPLPNEVTE